MCITYMKQTVQVIKNELIENSKILKNWKEDQAVLYNTCFNHTEARKQFFDIKEKVYSPQDFDQQNWVGAKFLAKLLKTNGVQCQVLRGNGSTSASGSDKAKNYFVIEKDDYGRCTSNTLYLNFDMNEQNVKEIVAILEKYYIAFTWEGGLGSCITFNLDREGYPE